MIIRRLMLIKRRMIMMMMMMIMMMMMMMDSCAHAINCIDESMIMMALGQMIKVTMLQKYQCV